MQMSSHNTIGRFLIKDGKKIWYPKNTPQHHLFLNLFFPDNDIYIKGYKSLKSVDESTATEIFYKNRLLTIHFDYEKDEFVIPVSETSCERCKTINEIKNILRQSIDGLNNSELEKIKGFKWNSKKT